MRIPIIISDNYTEFKWLEEFITLTHRNILTLCVYFDYLTMESAKVIFEDINSQLSKPSTNTFDDFYKRSIREFKIKGWCDYLGMLEI